MSTLTRFAFTMGAAALFAGCGGSQPPIGTQGAMPQSATAKERVHRASESSGALIYATGGCGGTCVLSYPQGKVVAQLSQYGGAPCSDAAGNVFIPTVGQVVEYQHGGTTPIATLSLPSKSAGTYNCSVDPNTNNLAVTSLADSGLYVAVFANESGTPTLYSPRIDGVYCGYDNAGNLFGSGNTSKGFPAISELARGQSTFTPLSINGSLGAAAGQVQWDGSYITWQGRAIDREPASISRLTISGSTATVVSTTSLKGKVNRSTLSWIYSGRVLMPYSTSRVRFSKIAIWPYPQGGKPKSIIKFDKFTSFQG